MNLYQKQPVIQTKNLSHPEGSLNLIQLTQTYTQSRIELGLGFAYAPRTGPHFPLRILFICYRTFYRRQSSFEAGAKEIMWELKHLPHKQCDDNITHRRFIITRVPRAQQEDIEDVNGAIKCTTFQN